MAIVESLEMRKRLCCGSMERELHISRKVVQELLKLPKALMKRLIKWKIIMIIISHLYRFNSFNICCYEPRTCLKYT